MIYRFYDIHARQLENKILAEADFPVYHALACILIDKLCKNDITYL